jgi:adenosine kinase, putative
LINKFDIDYTAGGATQNTMRFIQWIIGHNQSVTTFVGCIGNDYFGRMMEKKAKSDGVKVLYALTDETATGTCAVLETNHGSSRCLCAYLGAAEKLNKEHLIRNWHWVEKAKIYYVSGHTLSVTPDSVKSIAHQVNADKFVQKRFMFNLAASYVSEKHGHDLMDIMPYVDFLFGNEPETLSFAQLRGYKVSCFVKFNFESIYNFKLFYLFINIFANSCLHTDK